MRQPGARGFAVAFGAVSLIVAVAGYGAEGPHWTYAGATGPAKWGNLEKGFEECKLGQTQSPIDIPDASARKGDIASLLFNYNPGSFVTVDGKQYELVQFHFHKPSEEKINGRGHDMVAHLVHRGPGGKLGVIAVLLDAGRENRLIKTLWDNLPKEKAKENVVNAVTINVVDLLPQNKGYYTFAGSLTTPPCSQDVTWFVLKTPVEISAVEIAYERAPHPAGQWARHPGHALAGSAARPALGCGRRRAERSSVIRA